MTQIERDLTYRLDALKSVCSYHGIDSLECQSSIDLWSIQHEANFRHEKILNFNSAVTSFFLFLLLVIVGLFFAIQYYYKISKPHKAEHSPPPQQS